MSSPKKKSKTAKERRQEREKEILSKQVSRAQVIAELDKYIRDSSTATVALNALVEKGCNRERILWHLYQFCGGNPADADAVKSAFASRRESLLKVSEHLTGILSELETAKIYLSDVGFEYTYPQNFIDMIPSVAESIRELAKRAVGRFASQRTSGRDHHLVFLVNMIKNVTGGGQYQNG